MLLVRQCSVKYHPQIPGCTLWGDSATANIKCDIWCGTSTGVWTYDKQLCLVSIELEFVNAHPVLNVLDALLGSKDAIMVIKVYWQPELRIICIEVEVDSMLFNNSS